MAVKKTNAVYFFGIILAITGILVYTFVDSGANDSYVTELTKFRRDKDEFFKESGESPVEKKETFTRLNYFPPNQTFRIRAALERISDTTQLRLRMTGGEEERFVRYAFATFTLRGETHKLVLLKQQNDAEEKLFLPFTDKTNGFDTYGGGRYLDVEPPQSNQVVLDFNFAYNPFCAYNYNYTCPVPPAENHLDLEIRAGEREFADEVVTKKK